MADATRGPPRTGTVGPASRPAAGAMLTLLRLSCSPPATGANFLRPHARQLSAVADARRTAVYTPFSLERRQSPARTSNGEMPFDHIALWANAVIGATRRQVVANDSSAAPTPHPSQLTLY